ncbi:MAG: hypothetical protein ACREM2_06670 [Vulcanimicrobiaceae bacterium]
MKRAEHLFVVRMWQEAGDGSRTPWRGSVEHVGTGERRFFSSLVDLTEFLAGRVESKDVQRQRTP